MLVFLFFMFIMCLVGRSLFRPWGMFGGPWMMGGMWMHHHRPPMGGPGMGPGPGGFGGPHHGPGGPGGFGGPGMF